jgi:hypothetical protein
MTTLTVVATDSVTGLKSSAVAAFTVTTPPPPSGLIVGATTGQGAGNLHATPDLAGWQSYQSKTGTHAACIKLFDVGAGYPNLPASWSGVAPSMVANNAGHPVMVLYAFNNVPSVANFTILLSSLPAGQRIGFVYQSEAENSITGAVFVAGEHTISQNLNAALTAMASHPVAGNAASFYTRVNFPNINSAYMAYYQTNPGSTAFIPALGDVDAYGADLYHKGSLTNNVCLSDPRFAGYVKSVHAKVGSNVAFAFPEYGIDLAGIASDAARAALLKADYLAMTGTSAPGSKGLLLFNYWFEVGNSGQQYLFSQPSQTAQVWAQICAGTL